MPRVLLLVVFCAACGDDSAITREDVGATPDVALGDVGPNASAEDASANDASVPGPDALEPDAGNDSGPVESDASMPDAGPMGPRDEIDFSSLSWLYPDISAWPITSELRVSFSGSNVCLEYDKKDEWPVVQIFGTTDVVANAWVFAASSGQWYAATFEWMRPGQTCKAQAAVDGNHIKRSPFDESSGWAPESGEELYFMVSGLIRSPTYSNVMERTNVVRARWP